MSVSTDKIRTCFSIVDKGKGEGKGKGKGKVHPRTGYEDPEVKQMYSCTFSLTLALDGGGWSMLCSNRFTLGKTSTHCIGGWVGPRASLKGCRKSHHPPLPIRIRFLDHPAHKKSLYQLHCGRHW
jgi:hypothetical protein